MRTLDRQEAMEFNAALRSKDLKAKHVSGQNYVSLINLTRKLKRELDELGEREKEAGRQTGTLDGDNIVKGKEQDFFQAIRPLQNDFKFEAELNFIPMEELKEYTKEQDTAVAAILFEYLLKS